MFTLEGVEGKGKQEKGVYFKVYPDMHVCVFMCQNTIWPKIMCEKADFLSAV